ncbi:hypothetical protein L2E82_37628 [Cichorium intybus]|uniref:Uncharacterized protein n=1 Tax=Cichorium intybus TaxID=13427 RepID=A0ACB9AFG3_CICIN|nr:hypothetical protein L2E82_37628 [Cichorium intybus]
MASSSSNKSCLHCHDSSSDCFSNGWKLRNGEYAQLCNRCSYEFNLGRFCEAFHSDEDGWRDCVSCGKLVHCGCIVSLGDYLLLDFNGVICIDCSKTKCINPESESALIPMFEKILTVSDADSKLGRIVIPRKHAEAYFPEITDPLGIQLSVLDTEGIEWDVNFRFWPHLNSKMYVLKGLKDFIRLKNVQAGDTVAFYARESDGKIIMEVRKNHQDFEES